MTVREYTHDTSSAGDRGVRAREGNLMKCRSLVLVALVSVALLGASLLPAGATTGLSVEHLENWGAPAGLLDGQFTYPQDAAADKWGNVYVTGNDINDHRVQMFTSEGVFVTKVGATGDPNPNPSVLHRPRSITTDRWGNVWVTERGNDGRVNRFHPGLYGGAAAETWTGSGIAPETIADPTGIAVANDGGVYTILGSSYVQRWTSTGDYFTSWTTEGRPYGVAVGPDGEVYATNDKISGAKLNHVMVYTWFGMPVRHWGGTGTDPGELVNPYDLGVDGGGHVFVVDTENSRVQAFTSHGAHLATFGSLGAAPDQLAFPYGLGVGFDRTVYVADTFHHRISKWAVDVPTSIVKVAGANRYATAKAASEKAFPSPEKSEYAVVATGLNWPDALGGTALAGALKAPLLLTHPDVLSPEVASELARLNVQEIIVLGGEGAVKPEVYNALTALVGPGDIKRIDGADRYETATLIMEAVIAERGAHYDGTAFVVTGANFPDALAASPIATANGWPVVLTKRGTLPGAVKNAMLDAGVTHGYIIGGEGAVSVGVEDELNAEFIEFGRYGGTNRYTTAALVAQAGFDGMGMLWSRPAIATGEDFPDALAGGVLQGSDYSVMLLTPPNQLHSAAAAALKANAQSIYELRFLGGKAAISAATRTAATALLP